MSNPERLVLAYLIIFALVVWSVVWKLVALWKASRRDHLVWYVVLAVVPPLAGIVEMAYVFFVAPRYPDLCGDTGQF